ncbi:DUF2971 domain-containing protein [Sphingomonas faeni]|uniref:DUF2971 domain-containing protein n=1 Tax=Sphingomonas faeni TaxID=185950 RepID=UPI00334F7C9B
MFAQQLASGMLNEALFAYSIERTRQIRPDDRFAHYTSLAVAEKIIETELVPRNLWLRNSQGMNDFSEVSHGLDCLNDALDDWRLNGRFERALNAIHPDMSAKIMVPMMMSGAYLADRSYLTSLSLHSREEALSGKLSMWRAYGLPQNVCLVFNTQPFLTYQTAWELVLSPVLYGGAAEFKREFEALIQRLERCAGQLSSLDPAVVQADIVRAMEFAVLSTKHRGFHEEVEWRIIHQHSDFRPDPPSEKVTVNGKEELVYHLQLENNEKAGIWGSTLNEALDRIIVGPVANSGETIERLVDLLGGAGILRAKDRVVSCGIPFRSV